MKSITLSQGKVAIVDDGDFDWLNQWKWTATKHKNTWYAIRRERRNEQQGLLRKTFYMHRVVSGFPKGMEVDHVNGNGLDNRRENLRVCTHFENQRNRGKQSNNTSGYKGVSWNKKDRKYYAQIWIDGRKIILGTFSSPIEAAKAYDREARKHNFSQLNFPD